ncbi:MAG: rhodanese-like domain-containing protein, partial [Oscillospiraceae bacterium]
ITMDEAAKLLKTDKSIILLDVRTLEEHNEGYIQNSLHLPVQEIEKVKTVIPDINAKIFVYCKSGMRSKKACGKMHEMGYTDITNIGGMNTWKGEVVKG